ncbi:hypothetical protein Dimus_038664 [Dionaea muscipula]
MTPTGLTAAFEHGGGMNCIKPKESVYLTPSNIIHMHSSYGVVKCVVYVNQNSNQEDSPCRRHGNDHLLSQCPSTKGTQRHDLPGLRQRPPHLIYAQFTDYLSPISPFV